MGYKDYMQLYVYCLSYPVQMGSHAESEDKENTVEADHAPAMGPSDRGGPAMVGLVLFPVEWENLRRTPLLKGTALPTK